MPGKFSLSLKKLPFKLVISLLIFLVLLIRGGSLKYYFKRVNILSLKLGNFNGVREKVET